MKVFITASFQGEKNKKEIEELCSLVASAGFEDFCFIRDIENYQKVFENPKLLMKKVKEEINKCEALLFDATKKSSGRAIEAGIAFQAGKRIIVILKKGVKAKDSVLGIADEVIIYRGKEDLQRKLLEIRQRWQKHKT